MAGRFGWKSGYLRAVNVQSGSGTVADGNSSVSVTFPEEFDEAPHVVASAEGADHYVYVSNVTSSGCDLNLNAAATGSVDVNYVALDEPDWRV